VPDEIVVVFDCVTLVQSLTSERGPAARCLELFEEGKIKLAVSREIHGVRSRRAGLRIVPSEGDAWVRCQACTAPERESFAA
jgi:hypothetical protein